MENKNSDYPVTGRIFNASNSGGDNHNISRKERCPWPFVFFHDPKTGMKDWQTWCVVGLSVCWVWSRTQKNGR